MTTYIFPSNSVDCLDQTVSSALYNKYRAGMDENQSNSTVKHLWLWTTNRVLFHQVPVRAMYTGQNIRFQFGYLLFLSSRQHVDYWLCRRQAHLGRVVRLVSRLVKLSEVFICGFECQLIRLSGRRLRTSWPLCTATRSRPSWARRLKKFLAAPATLRHRERRVKLGEIKRTRGLFAGEDSSPLYWARTHFTTPDPTTQCIRILVIRCIHIIYHIYITELTNVGADETLL